MSNSDKRPSRHERGYTNKWDKARSAYLKRHPKCVMCGDDATCVDHITPHKMDMRLFWNKGNWQALCHPCHNRKTASDKTGKPVSGCDEDGSPLSQEHHWNA